MPIRITLALLVILISTAFSVCFGAGFEISIQQRSEKSLQTVGDDLYLSVGDVTRGQVMTGIYQLQAQADGSKTQVVLLQGQSMRVGDTREFRYRGKSYQLRLKRLNNVWIGEDMAIFELSSPSSMPQEVTRGNQTSV